MTVLTFYGGVILIERTTGRKIVQVLTNTQSPGSKPANESDDFVKLVIPQRETPFFTLKPANYSLFGILPKQEFVLAAKYPTDTKFIEKFLRSDVPILVTPVSPTEFRLIPTVNMKSDQVLSVRLAVDKATDSGGHVFDRDYTWSFQTQGKFRVTGSLPGDKKKDVPRNTGVEIVFSQDDYKDPLPYISIVPPIQYRTERHGQTWAIVPTQPLYPKTIYTVTLKKGLDLESRHDPIGEDYIFSFQTEELTANQPAPYLSINDTFIQTSPSEPPVFKVYTSNWPAGGTIQAKIYKFNTGQEFIDSRKKTDANAGYWWNYYQEDKPVDTKNMGLVAQADITIQVKDYLSYVQLPAALPEGNYLVQFRYNDGKKLEQSWVQSTPLTGFVTAGKVQTLVWANDLMTGDPASSSAVNIAGQGAGYYTSQNGVSVFSTPDVFFEPSVHYLQISTPKGQALYLPVKSLTDQEKAGQESENDYWTYVYHERRLYKNSDTVNFWGVVKNRNTNTAPELLNVRISKGRYDEEKVTIAEKDIAVSNDGSFMGDVSYQDLPSGWYYLELRKGNLLLTSDGFEVINYVKPEMKIDVSADKKAVFAGEKVNFNASLNFFDGTPGKQVKMAVHEERSANVTNKTTDNAGQINYEYHPVYDGSGENYNYYPRYESITVNPELSSGQTIEGYGSVMVYGSRVMLTSDNTQDNNKATIKAVLNRVDLTRINADTGTDTKGSLIANADITLTVTKNWWEQISEGTYYDFTEKVTLPSYRYQEHHEVIIRQVLKTNNAGEASYTFDMEKGKSYTAVLTAGDENGRQDKVSEYFYYYENYTQNNQQISSPTLTLNKKDNLYSLNENVEAKIIQGGKVFTGTDKYRYLFIAASRGRQDYFVENVPQETFPFTEKYIPNVTLGAVMFTGKHYTEVSGACEWDWYCYDYGDEYRFNGVVLKFKSDDKKLDLSVTSNKQKYLPGETAIVTVNVTRKGIPQVNTEVNLVLVDQALAAIGGVIEPNTLSSLYKLVPDQIYYGYYSHKPSLPSHEAEMGGGGGDNREIFKDTAFFGRAKTDSGGKAVFTFKLADNITTWIIYGQAVGGDLEAGQKESKLVVSKDFFVTNEAPREYLTADKPQMAGAGFGNILKSGDVIDYQAMVYQKDELLTKLTGTKGAFTEISFPLPGLPAGDYKSAIRGTFGDNTDQVTYPFKVVDSRINFKLAKTYNLTAGDEIKNPDLGPVKQDQPVRLVISDRGQGIYFNLLDNYCYTSSNRLEKLIAQKSAKNILLERFNITNCGENDWEQTKFQDTDGGLSQVKWGSSNLETTIWAVWVSPEGFDREKLISYLQNKADGQQSGSMQKIYAYWGLTLMGKPQINVLDSLVSRANTAEEKLVGALALASAGETEKARDLYFNILADYAYTNKPYIRIQGADTNSVITNTARALLLGSLTEKEFNPGLYAYLRDYSWQASDVVLDLSTIEFVNEEISKLPNEPTKVAVSTATVQKTVNLSQNPISTIAITPQELNNLKISTVSGKAEARINYYTGADGLNSKDRDNRLTITRSYKKATGEGTVIKPGDIVEVKLQCSVNYPAPAGGYGIEDYLPSGLVYLANPWAYGLKTNSWVWQKDNQIISGSFYNYPGWNLHDNCLIVYYARAAFPGTYTAEPAIFQSRQDLSVFQTTASETITIENR